MSRMDTSTMEMTCVMNSTARHATRSEDLLHDATLTLHREFTSIVKEFANKKDATLSDVVDVCGGFAQTCDTVIVQLHSVASRAQADAHHSQSSINDLANEMFTWRLLHALYSDRAVPLDKNDIDLTNVRLINQSKLINQTHLDDVGVHERLMYTLDDYREMNVIRAWLEQCAAYAFDDRHVVNGLLGKGYLYGDTLEKCKRENKNTTGLFAPDGVHTNTSSYTASDLSSLDRLNDVVFRYIRCGHMEKAVELCNELGVGHMAAVLLGQEMYERRTVTDEEGKTHVRETGNPNRALWMQIAHQITQHTSLSLKERSIYASLCGRLSMLLGQCADDALHDRLWAYIVCATLEMHRNTTEQMHKANNPDAPRDTVITLTGEDTCDYSLQEVVDKLATHVKTDTLYTAVQRAILAGDMVKCVRTLYDFARDSNGEEDRLRFAAHVLLVLRALVDEVDGDQSTAILWMYIRHLISTENGNDFSTGIAYYVSQLDARPLQIDAFAQYSAGLDGFAPGVTRVTICETALDSGLPMHRVIVTIVRRALQGYAQAVSDAAEYAITLCAALHWLKVGNTICPTVELLRYTNLAVAYFLDNNDTSMASTAMSHVPVGVADEADLDEQCVATFESLHNYIRAVEAFEIYTTHFNTKPGPASETIPAEWQQSRSLELRSAYTTGHAEHAATVQRWEATHKWNTESATQLLTSVLTSEHGWLTSLKKSGAVFPADPTTTVDDVPPEWSLHELTNEQSARLATSLRQNVLPQVVGNLLRIARDTTDVKLAETVRDLMGTPTVGSAFTTVTKGHVATLLNAALTIRQH